MKRFILAAILGMFAIPAWSADLPTKPVYQAPVPGIWSWSGFYLGAHVTGAWEELTPQNIAINKAKPTGWGGGGQLMGLYQFPHYTVLGVIVDADVINASAQIPGSTATVKGDFQGTLRAILGYAGLANGFLPYVTGGIAGAKNNATIVGFKSQATSWGWVVGGGAMFAIPQTNWSVYAEGLYIGDANSVFTVGGAAIGTKYNETVVKAGLNYKL